MVTALPAGFLAALAAMIIVYLILIELGQRRFYVSPLVRSWCSRCWTCASGALRESYVVFRSDMTA